jgi:hypothetical protein
MTINKEVAQTVIDWLEGGAIHVTEDGTKIGFDMGLWNKELSDRDIRSLENPEFPNDCGTAMCIGGAINQFFNTDFNVDEDEDENERVAEVLAATTLGISEKMADELFYPWDCEWFTDAGSQTLTPKYMAGVLRRLVETGELIG